MTWFTLAAALFPAFALVAYFATRDVFPEPTRLLIKTFVYGILIIPPVLMVAMPVAAQLEGMTNAYLLGTCQAFLTAAIPEEFFKLFVVAGVCVKWADFDEPMDGLVYGAVASLGFAALENVLYVSQGGLGVALIRAFTAVPAHACFGAIMGYFVARAKFEPERKSSHLLNAFLIPTLIHGLYDVPPMVLSAMGPNAEGWMGLACLGLVLCVLLPSVRWTVNTVQRLRSDQIALDSQRPQGMTSEIASD